MRRFRRQVACLSALWFALLTTAAPGLHTCLGHDGASKPDIAQARAHGPRDAADTAVLVHRDAHGESCLACVYLSTVHSDGAPVSAAPVALAPADAATPVDETPTIAAEHSPLSPRAPPISL